MTDILLGLVEETQDELGLIQTQMNVSDSLIESIAYILYCRNENMSTSGLKRDIKYMKTCVKKYASMKMINDTPTDEKWKLQQEALSYILDCTICILPPQLNEVEHITFGVNVDGIRLILLQKDPIDGRFYPLISGTRAETILKQQENYDALTRFPVLCHHDKGASEEKLKSVAEECLQSFIEKLESFC